MIAEGNEIWTVKDAAAYLHVHPSTVYRLLKEKQLPAFKVGTNWRFYQADIETWTRNKSIETWTRNKSIHVV